MGKQNEITIRSAVADLRVLIADDSEFDRLLISSCLMRIGFRTIQFAENGSIAMTKIENSTAIGKPFDMIFIDWRMPQHDGQSLARWIRSQSTFRKTPLFLTTAELKPVDVQDFQKLGITDFIVKPASFEVLFRKVTEYLVKKQNGNVA
ncbi:response regulator receiver protein [Bdellovibrio bacteriovorus W]|nr:response regulator receiver protein [Bdellovibrio bacteriovorus W]